jgi:hypothetical protein
MRLGFSNAANQSSSNAFGRLGSANVVDKKTFAEKGILTRSKDQQGLIPINGISQKDNKVLNTETRDREQ